MKKIILFLVMLLSVVNIDSNAQLLMLSKKQNTTVGVIDKPQLVVNIGQSNNVGTGGNISWIQDNYPEHMGTMSKVFQLSGSSFVSAYFGITSTYFSPTLVACKLLSDYYNVNFHLIQNSVGGTFLHLSTNSLKSWNVAEDSSESLYLDTNNKIAIATSEMNNLYGAGNWDFLFIDWNQGESDTDNTATYESMEWDLIQGFIGVWGNNFEFITSGVKIRPLINVAKQHNAAKSRKVHYYSNDELVLNADNTHYDSPSHWAQGVKTANIIKRLYAKP